MKSMTNNNLGKNLLVEDCQKISVVDILRKYKLELKENLLRSQFEIMKMDIGLTTSQTGNNGTRFWFLCPTCNRRVGVLLIHPLQGHLGCRKCLNLEYKKRRYKGMLESKLI